MKLITLLLQNSRWLTAIAVLTSLVSGMASSGLIAMIHSVLAHGGRPHALIVWSFAGLCLLMPVTRIISQVLLSYLAQKAVYDLRMQLSRIILAAPLRQLEQMGAHRLMAVLTDDVLAISTGLISIPVLLLQTAILFGCVVYLGWLSKTAFMGVGIFIVLGFVGVQAVAKRARRFMAVARAEQNSLFGHLRALTEGIKELKLHRRRRRAFQDEILQATAGAFQRHNVTGNAIFSVAGSWAQFLFFALVGLLLFAGPRLQRIPIEIIMGYTLTLLFMLVPLDVIWSLLPNLTRASVALKNVESLGLSLEHTSADEPATPPSVERRPSWNRLELAQITHTYYRERENDRFTLGPIDLTLRPGELVFLVGGNGSGKTTLAKLITGLYVPETGEIRLDGQPITETNRENYRQLFSAVFSDFYLFDSLLGMDSPDLDAEAQSYLAALQLDHKVQIKDGILSTIDLSRGQRKRLALLTAFMEDRPIYVFDEWAADQDPVFKEFFYRQLLPELKARNKAVLVITHDDRYFHQADCLIRLDYGRLATAAVAATCSS